MKMIVYAGVVALALVGLLPMTPGAFANEFAYSAEHSQAAMSVDIGRIRSALHLTSQQEPLWAPVEAALRDIVQQQQAHSDHAGFIKRVSNRVVSIVLTSTAVERLAKAARPLIAALDDQQKQTANGLAQEMGLGPVVMSALR